MIHDYRGTQPLLETLITWPKGAFAKLRVWCRLEQYYQEFDLIHDSTKSRLIGEFNLGTMLGSILEWVLWKSGHTISQQFWYNTYMCRWHKFKFNLNWFRNKFKINSKNCLNESKVVYMETFLVKSILM